jgi:16S rRNA (cytosine1402-N4)-methyltransferase
MTTLSAEKRQAPAAHLPVMVTEALLSLSVMPGGSYIDCNLGDGGHTASILKAVHGARVLGIDLDKDALYRTASRLSRWRHQVELCHGNFADVFAIAQANHYVPVCGVLFDLGVSSAQIDTPERGFSFRHEGRPDMRFDSGTVLTAYDIVNRWPESRLEEIICELGEEPRGARVARGIVRNRRIESTRQLADVVTKALNWPAHSRNHPATRTFQAIRMAVNGELECLERGLSEAVKTLQPRGRLVVISYHSLEDRLVKEFIRDSASGCSCPPMLPECICEKIPTLKPVSKGVIKPTISEVRSNPRARSARMRVAERV